MGTKIVVDTQNLITVSKEIINYADSYKVTANNIFQEVNQMGASWSGIDNLAFVSQINGFKDDFARLDELLRKYAEMLIIVDKEYIKTLNDSVAIANSI